jgi:hypothetical protein
MKKINLLLILICLFIGRSSAFGVATTAQNTVKPQSQTISAKPISTLQQKPSVPTQKPIVAKPISELTPAVTIAPTQPQAVDFSHCSKFFNFDNQKLFYLTLASINANRFNIDEIQTSSGYVIFTAAGKKFLASIIWVDTQRSMIKIVPCNNAYYFPMGIVQNMFKYIELNTATPIEKIPVL